MSGRRTQAKVLAGNIPKGDYDGRSWRGTEGLAYGSWLQGDGASHNSPHRMWEWWIKRIWASVEQKCFYISKSYACCGLHVGTFYPGIFWWSLFISMIWKAHARSTHVYIFDRMRDWGG